MASTLEAHVIPASRVTGRLRVPGDKSISHRYALFGALAHGVTTITGYSPGADNATTLACLRALGVRVDVDGATVRVEGRGLRGLRPPAGPIDAGNSGTTTRLLAGILAAHPFPATIVGDESLSRRPMRRVMAPLAEMGARFEATDGHLPLTVTGGSLRPIDYSTPVPSAQIKSAVLLAGLQTPGRTTVRESAATRDHTERALSAFDAALDAGPGTVAIVGERPLKALETAAVPGDLSSATFWCVAAAALPGSDVEIEDVGLNPTRTALLDVLARAGADVDRHVDRVEHGEPRGRVRIRARGLSPLVLTGGDVPALIDELPALAAMAACAGDLHVTGAGELRVKESDRIASLAAGLRALGGEIEEFADGFHVRAGRRLTGGRADAAGDHRLAMAFAIAALSASGPSVIDGAEAVDVSYPGFFDTLASLAR